MRIINRPLAFLLAVVLAVAGVLLIIEVIALAVNAKPVIVHWDSWYRWAEKTKWKAGVIRFWSIVLILIGVLLLALQLKPRRTRRMTVISDQADTDAAITRSGLTETLRRAATGVDGVADASVTAGKRKVTVTARTAGRSSDAATPLQEPVTTAVQQRLDGLHLTHPPRLSVRMTNRSG